MKFFLFLLALSVGQAAAQTSSCSAANCKAPACFCPSQSPPGGLSSRNIPQFITLTLDDAVTADYYDIMMDILGNNQGTRNPNGCPLPATFFVSTMYTEYNLVQRAYNQGNEVAVHTMNHLGDSSVEEILGAYRALNAWGGVPKKDLLGFRTPFLNYTTEVWKRLRGSGLFLYDSSMPVSPSNAYWPYTLDFGPANTCEVGTCDPNFKVPGLWQIPLYNMMNADGSVNTSMDPNPPQGGIYNATNPTYDEVQTMLRYNFNRNYNGNRIPFGIYLHVLWINTDRANRIRALKDFIAYTRTFSDVYWVTNQQLLAWMLNPTDVAGSLTNQALGCMTPPVNSGVCDGISKTGDRCIWTDANLFGGYYAFNTCFSCPTRPPNVTDLGPVPPQTNKAVCFVPDAGCAYPQLWDPQGCRCMTPTRVTGGVTPQRTFALGSIIPDWIGQDAVKNITNSTGGGGSNGGSNSSAVQFTVSFGTLMAITLMTLFI